MQSSTLFKLLPSSRPILVYMLHTMLTVAPSWQWATKFAQCWQNFNIGQVICPMLNIVNMGQKWCPMLKFCQHWARILHGASWFCPMLLYGAKRFCPMLTNIDYTVYLNFEWCLINLGTLYHLVLTNYFMMSYSSLLWHLLSHELCELL